MASGKKNYFRHSFFASEDQKIQSVIDSMGFEGYGYYFSLLELCGRQCSEEMKNPIVFHIQTVRKIWRKNSESTKKVLRKLEESGLFLVTFSEHSVSLDIPTFGKYLGRYESNAPNKRKEKEIKVNESKEAPLALTAPKVITHKNPPVKKSRPPLFEVEPLQLEEDIEASHDAITVLTMLNTICFSAFRPSKSSLKPINARLNEKYSLEDFKKVIECKNKEWSVKPDMKIYLRPSTLFGNHFDEYLNQARGSETMSQAEEDALIAKFFPGA